MAAPVIGITSYLDIATSGIWTTPAVFLPWSYAAPIVAAGGVIAVLPPQPATPDAVTAALDAIDGLYIAGGLDVDPALYGEAPHAETDAPRPDRDAWEFALLEGARERNLPTLGVCRGAQALNVSRGGTLVQHLPDVVGHTGYQGGDAVFRPATVAVEPGTLLATAHPAESEVPVYHHQSIAALGAGLAVSALSADGVIEAIEDPSLDFCLAVQWHPEQDVRPQIFEAFVRAASRASGMMA